jgi:hypothetical protein
MVMSHRSRNLLGLALGAVLLVGPVLGQRYLNGVTWPEPPVVTPGEQGGPPSDATVLFDGKSLDAWDNVKKTKVEEDGAFTVKELLRTKQSFGDCQLHVEFASPTPPSKKTGQGRGNNGIGLMDAHYEIQVLDSYQNPTYPEGSAGSVYNQRPPMVNASRRPGEWQTYDILFNPPRFDGEGKLQKPGYVTVLHNGVCVQNHTEILGYTYFDRATAYTKHPEKGPLVLMYHGDPVRFRNIWVREIKELEGMPGKKGKEGK